MGKHYELLVHLEGIYEGVDEVVHLYHRLSMWKFGSEQSSRKCCSAAAPLRAEQGPCEPSEDVVRKFGEQ